ncbi:YjjW family glycine radical enzyme activase [Wukongibacter baidiensis]|uniref:YjjW family glycine radical enzyme activase n=1 Tax=Wukongibacter baidiensis TaxID=1723361 RepID=UPI003D80007E
MCNGLINRIIPFSSVDGPGNRTAIFLQGCNYNCLYCHNPETINRCNGCGRCVDVCPYGALSIIDNKVKWDSFLCKECDKCLEVCDNTSSPKVIKMTALEVMKEILRVKSFISGITVSGGECTLQLEFVIDLFRRAKEEGLTTFLDTNGSVPLYERNDLIESMDMAMVDLKSYDSEEHKKLTGMDNKVVLKNIQYLASINKLYEVRTVIVPELLDNFNNVDMISKLIGSLDPSIRYKLIKYRDKGVRSKLIDSYTPGDEMMDKLASIATKNGCTNVIKV